MLISDSVQRALGEDSGRRRITRLLLVLSLASALAWAWAVRRAQVPAPVPASTGPAPLAAPLAARLPDAAALGRALGAPAATPEPSPAQRFQLLGVIAAASGRGAALIAVDGQPARPFAVGAQVAPGFVLQRLAAKEVMLGDSLDGPVTLSLSLAERPPPGSAPATPATQAAPLPPSESTAVQPDRRGDQRGP